MGVWGWRELGDNVELQGFVRSHNLSRGDGDWCIFIEPSPGFEHLLKNPAAPGPNVNGLVECEVEPPDTLRSPRGDLNAEDPVVERQFLNRLMGRRVIVVGTWVSDCSHDYNQQQGDDQLQFSDCDNGKTEIHPITSILVEQPAPDAQRKLLDLFVFSDASGGVGPNPPYAGQNRRARFSATFPLTADAALPAVRFSETVDMARSTRFAITRADGSFVLNAEIESGQPSDGLGFYFSRLELVSHQLPAAGVQATYGAAVKLMHVLTGGTLHSHIFPYTHPGSSGQQQVTAHHATDDDDNHRWRIKGPFGLPDAHRLGEPVRDGDVIRLEHVLTRRNLHSHGGHPSPITAQQEVTGFGQGADGDGNDNWRVEVEGGGYWETGRRVRLVHVESGLALHSHAEYYRRSILAPWAAGQQEVTAAGGRDDNDWWQLARLEPVQLTAAFVRGDSTLPPVTLAPGQAVPIRIAMRNTGSVEWSSAEPGPARLGIWSPQDNPLWGTGRVELPRSPVRPGEAAVFAFTATAPRTPGSYAFQWRMLRELVTWFGEPTPALTITVAHPDVGLNRPVQFGRDAEYVVVARDRTTGASLAGTADVANPFPAWGRITVPTNTPFRFRFRARRGGRLEVEVYPVITVRLDGFPEPIRFEVS